MPPRSPRFHLPGPARVGLTALATAVACASAGEVGPGAASADEATIASDREAAGRWNDTQLLDWVATLGDGESDYDALETIESFERLQRAIEEVKQMVLHDARSEQEAAEGLRMIVKHLAVATADTVGTDFRNPLFPKHDPRVRDVGAYNPDAEYDQAFIDGRYDYRLTGDLGSVPYLSITVNARTPESPGRVAAYLDDEAIRRHATPDGRFTLWLTKERPDAPGAWVALPDEANGVVIRQYVADRSSDRLASFALEAVGDRLPAAGDLSDAEIALRIAKAADYLVIASTWHRTLLPEMREQPNTFVSSAGRSLGADVANAENYYQMAYYEVPDDQALVVDFEAPDTVYWNLTSATIWHETHRYRTDPVSLTSREAYVRDDGRVRFVIARDDPGVPNWIRRWEHDRGFLILRIVGVTDHPLPATRLVPAAEVAALD